MYGNSIDSNIATDLSLVLSDENNNASMFIIG